MADVLRGVHATGIARVDMDTTKDMNVAWVKDAYEESIFKRDPRYAKILTNTVTLTALLGHNRHATKGNSSDPSGAHPFTHGHITLMHNGSLTSHYHLTKETFTVDSEAICKAFSEKDPREVIPTLRGAFALVWVDEIEQTLNFVRNDERPLSFLFDHKKNTIAWASEDDMLRWLAKREGLTFNPCDFDDMDSPVELPVGELWSFPLTKESVNLDEMTKEKVDIAPKYVYSPPAKKTYTRQTPTNSTTTSLATTQTSHSKEGLRLPMAVSEAAKDASVYEFSKEFEEALEGITSQTINRLGASSPAVKTYVGLAERAQILDERTPFWVTSVEPYSMAGNMACIKGTMVESPFSKIEVHGVDISNLKFLLKITGNMPVVLSSYLCGIQPTEVLKARANVTGLSDLQMEQDFTVKLRSDVIRRVKDIDEYDYALDKVPAEVLSEATSMIHDAIVDASEKK